MSFILINWRMSVALHICLYSKQLTCAHEAINDLIYDLKCKKYYVIRNTRHAHWYSTVQEANFSLIKYAALRRVNKFTLSNVLSCHFWWRNNFAGKKRVAWRTVASCVLAEAQAIYSSHVSIKLNYGPKKNHLAKKSFRVTSKSDKKSNFQIVHMFNRNK